LCCVVFGKDCSIERQCAAKCISNCSHVADDIQHFIPDAIWPYNSKCFELLLVYRLEYITFSKLFYFYFGGWLWGKERGVIWIRFDVISQLLHNSKSCLRRSFCSSEISSISMLSVKIQLLKCDN
jgi:hypothetical protein